ncbi:MAG: Hsp70 family protein [Saprospiraceae bacterium]|nr:Hsp70 family protein [Saprospiraceae bacterium]
MENTINYGIDLGTTNSAIAKFVKGEVIIFSNPQKMGTRTLPSIVGYKKDKILVGEQARVFAEKEPENVKSVFKRKMGTSESFPVKSLNQSKTPIELSTEILKELKTFVNTSDNLDAVVITIPASFDTVQSIATKRSRYTSWICSSGFTTRTNCSKLSLRQYEERKEMQNGQWLVYDLGGGTFGGINQNQRWRNECFRPRG